MTDTGASDHGAAGVVCVVCGAATRRLFQRHGYWIRGCTDCGHRAAEIRPSPAHVPEQYGDDYFFGGGAGYSDYLAEADLLRARGRQYGRLLNRHRTPGRVLDVGSAAGCILQGLVDEGWSGVGIEPNARCAEHARSQLGLDVRVGTLEQFDSPDCFDAVTMFQVVPHLADPAAALAAAAALTRPGGLWLIETWNRDSWTARLFGRRWHEYSPPSVLHWFSADGLTRLAARYGLHEVARGRPRRWISAAHAKSLLRYKVGDGDRSRVLSASLRLVPDRLHLPYPAEDLVWMMLCKR